MPTKQVEFAPVFSERQTEALDLLAQADVSELLYGG